MNKEDYVSLEVAKKLKEIGYEYITDWAYNLKFNNLELHHESNVRFPKHIVSAPTLYEVQKWLRVKYNIDVLPIIREESLPKKDYCCYIYKDAKVVGCKVAYGDDFYECMNDSLLEALKLI